MLHHLDIRVRDLEEAIAFYDGFLPELGLSLRHADKGRTWFSFAHPVDPKVPFFNLTQSAGSVQSENRIAFAALSKEQVDFLSSKLEAIGAKSIVEPSYNTEMGAGYYAVYFEDPSGNRLEICHLSDSD